MALKAKVLGREALMRKLNQLAPNVEKYSAEAKLDAAQDLAKAIAGRAPRENGDYADSVKAGRLSERPAQERVGIATSKDPSATGIYAKFIWRWLEFGTAPHLTTKGGGTVAGKKEALSSGSGMHPGTSPQPHIFPTYRAMKPKIRKRILAAVNKGVKEAMGK
ncbi:MAG: HK97 gp10 family phage protein [Rhizobium sp.]|nr:HK97 gp10 family phage protein [Rhizobium sp.]